MFENVIGQKKIINQLVSLDASDKVPHALMFSGDSGRGGLAIAVEFAQYLLCLKRENGKRCGECPNCQKTSQLIHPDLHFSFPVVKHPSKKRDVTFSDDFIQQWRKIVLDDPYFTYSDWLNHIQASEKQGDINVTECNEIIKKLSLKSFGGGKKILVLWLPELLGKESNRLLKLIEEPPEDTVLIFVTGQEEVLLKTIISRFQIFKLPPISEADMVNALQKRADIDVDEARQISLLTEGNFIDAQALISGNNQDLSELVINWLRICYQQNSLNLLSWTEKFSSFPKEVQKQVLSYTLFILREFIRLKYIGEDHVSLQNDELIKLKGLSSVLSIDKAEEIAEIISESIYSIQRNANVRILMMADSLQIGKIIRRKEVSII
jgi:DNA polymerase-3 subunit delta'